MSIKRKLILIGICIFIIIAVFAFNVVKKIQGDLPGDIVEETIASNVMTRAEAYRLLSYLEYDKTERETIPQGITYAEEDMSGWYDSFVNAVWKMGLIEGNVTVAPKEALTYRACKELFDNLIINHPQFQSVYQGLSFDFSKADKNMLIPEFLELYRAVLAIIPKEEQTIKEETLLVLGREVTEDGIDRVVTDQGKYFHRNAKSYEEYWSQSSGPSNSSQAITNSPASPSPGVKGEKDNEKTQSDKEAITADENQTSIAEKYMDQGIRALVCEKEILFVTSEETEKIVLHNVWIKLGEGTKVDTFVNGIDKSFTAEYKLSSSIEKVVGDITILNQKVVQISVKPDMIEGKVLRSGDGFIEVEGYGEIPLEENFQIYKIYGTISLEPTGSILVGYENTDFIVSDGKISAALITESIKAENIRVLLKTTNYKNIYHQKVELTSSDSFTVRSGDTKKSYEAGKKVTIEPGSDLLNEGRLIVEADSDTGKIELLSINRSYGSPKYRGRIEVAEDNNGLLIVNELPMEEYLYAVIPSEMPTYYGKEALKVQAVCARSYAYKNLIANSLSKYGAHVDDSVSYQVYNNIAENEDSILAVKDTYGKVIEYEGEVINAYYFSTSCGHTAEASSAWVNDVDIPYLDGKLLLVEGDGEGAEEQSAAVDLYEDLSSEETFQSFINATDITTYDSSFGWYRWKVTMSTKEIENVIDATLANRYKANPELILTMTKKGESQKDSVYESIPIETVGTIKDITVLKRESSGMISELLITGSKNTIKVRKEYNIRALLAPTYDTVIRQDDSEVDNLSLLPSAFFTMDKKKTDNKLSSITLTGGGYGHGVGMSQNGVKALSDEGKGYEDIVTYFYEGTSMGFIYE